MTSRFPPLATLSPGAPEAVARLAGRGDASVHLSARLVAPAFVCLDRRQLTLDGDRCGVEALLVYARLVAGQRIARRWLHFTGSRTKRRAARCGSLAVGAARGGVQGGARVTYHGQKRP